MTSTATAKPKTTRQERVNAVMAEFLCRAFGKETRRDLLEPADPVDVSVSIAGEVGRRPYRQQLAGTLAVGADHHTSSSVGADPTHLIAVLLAELPATRRKRIVDELPERFAKAGARLPEIDPGFVAAAKSLLERLRVKTTRTAKGAVKVTYECLLPKEAVTK